MAIKQGEKSKVVASIKIDPDLLADAKEWAFMHRSNFSAMVEALVKNLINNDREKLEKYKEETKKFLDVAFSPDLMKTHGIDTSKHEVTITKKGVDVTDRFLKKGGKPVTPKAVSKRNKRK